MTIYRIFGIIGICCGVVFPCSAQENSMPFVPVVFWTEQFEQGVILASPKEMVPVDINGEKYPKILTSEPVGAISMSPDGKKIAYTTSTGLWIVSMDSMQTLKVYTGMCDVPRWNKDGSAFVFAAYEKTGGAKEGVSVKLFRADGDGKNVKQVYP